MEGLLRRLAPGEAENALRVIAFFDRLVESRGGIDELVRSSARLVGLPAGFEGDDPSESAGFDARGRPISSAAPDDAVSHVVLVGDRPAGTVWITRSTDDESLSALIAERMALASSMVLARSRDRQRDGEQSPVGVLVTPNAALEARVAAAQALGFRPDWSVQVLAIGGPEAASKAEIVVKRWTDAVGARSTPLHRDDAVMLSIVHHAGQLEPPTAPGLLTAFGSRTTVLAADDSLRTAKQVIRLTSEWLGPHRIDYETLGPLTHIAAIPPEQAHATPIVQQLLFLAQSETGPGEVLALDTFCRTRSLRAASAELNLHHSSVAHRLSNVERKLGVDLGTPGVLFELTLAMQLVRIASW
jgi:PucR C-terminal helix-turn-helix domain